MKTHFINFFLVLYLLISSQNSHAQSTSSVRSDGTILYNGQPFFPFGFYGVEQNDLHYLKEGGFNIAFNYFEGATINTIDAYLDEANAQNIKIIAFRRALNSPSLHNSKPALLAWGLYDDIKS